MLLSIGSRIVKAYSDSQLVVRQIKGEYQAKEPSMIQYLSIAQKYLDRFDAVNVIRLPRNENTRADILSKLASSSTFPFPRSIFVEFLPTPQCHDYVECLELRENESEWYDPIVAYLKDGILPNDNKAAARIQKHSLQYIMDGDKLLRRSFTMPLLRCLGKSEAEYVLREIHEGCCGNHSGGRSLARKTLRQGYYWPTMEKEALEMVRRCDACQRFSNVPRAPANSLSSIVSPLPFFQWGMDTLGPFTPTKRRNKHLLLATDYFTKWVEAEAYPTITAAIVEAFVWKNIICRYGVPQTVIADHGTYFDNERIRSFFLQHHIQFRMSSVAYPQANGQAESTL